MSAKRALVVDDSKSARAFLARILERHEIAVDAAESAEAALEYLARNKPDIIFMDHMMPGMDGFQAVQTIKNNPRTSAIPILMYTSQEGDLYLGQARALGAEGVLPKQIKQSDVTKMLYQLRLVADRRGDEQTTFARVAQGLGGGAEMLPANESAIVVTAPAAAPDLPPASAGEGADISKLLPQMSLEIRAALDVSLQKELVALRSFLVSKLDSQAERIETQLTVAQQPAPPAPTLDLPTLLPERRPWSAIFGWSLAVLAVGCTAAMSWLWYQQGSEIAALRTDLDAAYAEVETLRSRPVVSEAPAAPAATVGEALVPAADAEDLTHSSATLTTTLAVSAAPAEAASLEAPLSHPVETAAATPTILQAPAAPPTPAPAAPAISSQAQ
jgi:CheY-like chemotaxis protein